VKFKTLMLAAAAVLSLGACSQIDDNQIGLKRVYGQLQDQPVAGLQWYNPWSTDIITFDNQQTPIESDLTTPTHDQQRAHVTAKATVQLSKTNAAAMYRNVGPDWAEKIVPQVLRSVQVGEIGKQTALTLIQNQAEIETNIRTRLSAHLRSRGIILTDFQITGVKFSDEYMAAVEQKATAVQRAEGARNQTAQIREQGEQTKIRAIAEAEAMRVRAQALETNPNLIEYERLNVQRAAIDAWKSGGAQVPTTVMGGTGSGVPFVNVPLNGGK